MKIWVVEIWNNALFCKPKWQATVGVGLCRQDGRTELKEWKRRNPCDKFRLRCYSRIGFNK